jgi:hypothetical protein
VALTVFKTVRDLTTSGWVGSIPMHSRQLHSTPVYMNMLMPGRALAGAALIGAVLGLSASSVGAQVARTDTVHQSPADSLKPPITPRRAFLYSFLMPGYAQSVLGRHKAATTFLLVEAIGVSMIRESAADAHEARRMSTDSIVVSWVDPQGNLQKTITPPPFSSREVKTRDAHVEDWVAVVVANHLLAGADAFVAAHLWDVPARLAVRVLPGGGASVAASLTW